MKTRIIKTISLVMLITCSAKINAQNDLLSVNTVNTNNLLKVDSSFGFPEAKFNISEFTPDPFNGNSFIRINCKRPLILKVRVFVFNGDIVREETLSLDTGLNELVLNMDDLATGAYMVQFYTSEGSTLRRFIKRN